MDAAGSLPMKEQGGWSGTKGRCTEKDFALNAKTTCRFVGAFLVDIYELKECSRCSSVQKCR